MDDKLTLIAAVAIGLLVLWFVFKIARKLIKVVLIIVVLIVLGALIYFQLI
jgi:hypothetical protein